MEYHVLINDQQAGPYTIEQLRSMWASGTVTLDTHFWTAGMPDWRPLRTIITTLQPTKPTPIAHTTSASSRPRDPGSQPTPTARRSYRSYAGAAIIAIVCVIAVAMVAMWMRGGRSSPSGSSITTTLLSSLSQPSAAFSQSLDKFTAAEVAKFQTHFDEFIREGSVLNSYTEQGVNYQTFGDQLAKTRAAFDLTYPDGSAKDLIQYQHFANAIRGWSTIYKLWHRKISGRTHLSYYGTDLDLLNSVLKDIDRQPVPVFPDTPPESELTTDQKASVSEYISIEMAYSAEQFQQGRSKPIPK